MWAGKKSSVVPHFKKGPRLDALNYRPITLTSVCCKALGRVIAAHLTEFLNANILCDDQFGFRSKRSVKEQLVLS